MAGRLVLIDLRLRLVYASLQACLCRLAITLTKSQQKQGAPSLSARVQHDWEKHVSLPSLSSVLVQIGVYDNSELQTSLRVLTPALVENAGLPLPPA